MSEVEELEIKLNECENLLKRFYVIFELTDESENKRLALVQQRDNLKVKLDKLERKL